MEKAHSEIPMRKPGKIDPFNLTELLREMIRQNGGNPDELEFGGLSEKGFVLTGEEAWKTYMKDWKHGIESNNKVISKVENFKSSWIPFAIQPPTAAKTQFEIWNFSNPPASGSITVHYDGVQLTTQYTSGHTAHDVGYMIYSNINNHTQIQLTASVIDSGKLIITEKRDGCDHNGNQVYVTHTGGTHITVNNDLFIMTGGTEISGCKDPVPPIVDPGVTPPPIYVSWGSEIATPPTDYGWVQMWSYSWASEPLHYLDVVGLSQKDFIILHAGQDGGYNRSSAIVGVSEYKSPFDDVSFWQQQGDHVFGISAQSGFQMVSSTSTHY